MWSMDNIMNHDMLRGPASFWTWAEEKLQVAQVRLVSLAQLVSWQVFVCQKA